jgi:UDP-N-acetylglucosamine--dolichyl-phosphate N-acetylglucosaminephosphotransferase
LVFILDNAVQVLLVTVVVYLATLALTILILRIGIRLGIVGKDVHKSWNSYAVRIGGLSLIIAPLIALIIKPSIVTLTLLLVSILAMVIGLIDDLRTLPAVRKVLLSITPGVIHMILGLYEPRLFIPFLGDIGARILYIFLIPLAYAVALNAANMMDTHNGLLAGSILVSLAVLSPLLILRSPDHEVMLFILSAIEASIAAFLILNIYPARVFVGNAGSFIIGSWIAFIGIYGRSEFLVVMALFPMIINGFSIITSIGGLKEKSLIKTRPVSVENGVIRANPDPKAPITIAHIAASSRSGVREVELVIGVWILFYIASTIAVALFSIAS